MRLWCLLALVVLSFGMAHRAFAQSDAPSEKYGLPLGLMHPVPVSQSLPLLVSEGWQIVGVSLRERTFAYHLVKAGALILCLSDVGRLPPGTECMRLEDGPDNRPDTSPSSR